MSLISKIATSDLIPFNAYEGRFPVVMDAVYADPEDKDNHFKGLYHPEAKIIWAHRELAKVTLIAAKICEELHGWCLQINDCLRPVEAQEAMEKYGYHPSLVSLPGSGGHPRAMAIDIQPIDIQTGAFVDMGTPFDSFADDPKSDNPAARNYTKFSKSPAENQKIMENRQKLENAMKMAATVIGRKIVPLPQEWWDFRFDEKTIDSHAALREADLKPYQRLINPDVDAVHAILEGDYPPEVDVGVKHVLRDVGAALEKLDFESKPGTVRQIPFDLR